MRGSRRPGRAPCVRQVVSLRQRAQASGISWQSDEALPDIVEAAADTFPRCVSEELLTKAGRVLRLVNECERAGADRRPRRRSGILMAAMSSEEDRTPVLYVAWLPKKLEWPK